MRVPVAAFLAVLSVSVQGAETHRGVYYYGWEVEEFQACGSRRQHWAVGSDRVLNPLRARVDQMREETKKAYPGLYVEVIGHKDPKASHPYFDDEGAFRIQRIVKSSTKIPKGCGHAS